MKPVLPTAKSNFLPLYHTVFSIHSQAPGNVCIKAGAHPEGTQVQDRLKVVGCGWRVGGSISSCLLQPENSLKGPAGCLGSVSKFSPQNLANPGLFPGVKRAFHLPGALREGEETRLLSSHSAKAIFTWTKSL